MRFYWAVTEDIWQLLHGLVGFGDVSTLAA